MKILIASLFLPQEKAYHAGGRYVFEIIRELSARHEIHLATRLEEGELPSLRMLRPFCREIHPYPYPALARRNLAEYARLAKNYLGFSRFADRLIKRGDFDLALVEWVEAGLLMRRGKTPIILDAHDVITKPAARDLEHSRGPASVTALLRYTLVKAAEKRTVRKFDAVFTRSEYDRAFLQSMRPDLRIRTVPHPAGLDITSRTFTPEKNTILFLASYKHRRVNVDAALWFYRQVFPRIRAQIPDARFVIAGYGPPEELTALAAKDAQVLVPGFVEDIDRCYKESAVFVAPILRGGGIIVKILDALAAGTPVVTTTFGNEGIRALPGRDLLIADEPEDFARAVVQVLTDPVLARSLAASGCAFVQDNYSVASIVAAIEDSFTEITRTGL